MSNSVASPVSEQGKSSQFLQNVSVSSSENLLLVIAGLGLAVSGVRFAMWMNSPTGRKWDEQHTWFVTVMGVTLTLAWYALHDWRGAMKVFGFFVLSGTPIVVRALALETQILEAYIAQEKKAGT